MLVFALGHAVFSRNGDLHDRHIRRELDRLHGDALLIRIRILIYSVYQHRRILRVRLRLDLELKLRRDIFSGNSEIVIILAVVLHRAYLALILIGKTSVEGTKTWDDANNQDGKRPTKIKVILNKKVGGGQPSKVAEKEVTQADGWKWRFENLDKYEKGQKIEYEIGRAHV